MIVLEFQNGELIENAGSKAPADASTILADNGFRRFFVITSGGSFFNQFFSIINSSFKLVSSARWGSSLLCQYPIYSKKGVIAFRFLRIVLKLKRVKIIALVHDLLFAARAGDGKKREIKELNKYDCLIVHSKQMASLLNSSGCTTPCIVLGLFDYLVKKTYDLPRVLSHTIAFAGNLSKSGFINHLEEVTHDSKVRFVLYGRNDPNLVLGSGIEYGGLFNPDDVSSLNGSWGLVWDGPSIDDLTGDSGLYQRINSPHKASLYLVAGLPLIVNSQAAIAQIVLEERIGLSVDSLMDIENRISALTEDDYDELLENVKSFAAKLTSGHNLLAALKQIG